MCECLPPPTQPITYAPPPVPPTPPQSALTNPEAILRCAAGEALGRMSQVGGDASFVTSMVQTSFDTLKSTQDPIARTGHALVLGCLHRYVGGMGSGHHLQSSVSILQTVAKDTTSPLVQVKGGGGGEGNEDKGGWRMRKVWMEDEGVDGG